MLKRQVWTRFLPSCLFVDLLNNATIRYKRTGFGVVQHTTLKTDSSEHDVTQAEAAAEAEAAEAADVIPQVC